MADHRIRVAVRLRAFVRKQPSSRTVAGHGVYPGPETGVGVEPGENTPFSGA